MVCLCLVMAILFEMHEENDPCLRFVMLIPLKTHQVALTGLSKKERF